MNLDALLIDPARLSGIWWDLVSRRPVPGNVPHAENPCVRIVPHGPAFDAAMARAYEPHLATRLRGNDLDESIAKRIRAQVLAEHALVDWRNVVTGNPPEPVPYSREQAVAYLTEPRWELLRRLIESAFNNETALLVDAERTASGN